MKTNQAQKIRINISGDVDTLPQLNRYQFPEIYSGSYGHHGNDKLGKGISVINRPAGIAFTCPGESKFCIECYAKKGNFKRYNIQLKYQTEIIKLPKKIRKFFRIHVSGDYDTVEYINDIIQLVTSEPDTYFWGYTRSWIIPELLPALEALGSLPNMQLFASCDETMPLPPTDWRIAGIQGDDRITGLVCPFEQCSAQCPDNCSHNKRTNHVPKLPDCKTCKYCFIKQKGNVLFVLK